VKLVKSKNTSLLALVATLASMLLPSCASTPSASAASIIEADEKAVSQCTFLALVSGSSMLGGAVQERARENARTAALESAAKKGATHIVWTDVSSTLSNGASAQGRAYRCP
jgi:hypothetical protein